MYFVANVVALLYAFLIGEQPLVIKYIIGIETSALYIGIFVFYRLKKVEQSLNL